MKKFFCVFMMCILFICVTGVTMAENPSCDGRPRLLDHAEKTFGAFIWHDSDGFHVRSAITDKDHIFTGVIRTNGRFDDVSNRFFKKGDKYWLEGRNKLHFTIAPTKIRTVGFDFSVLQMENVSLELYVDGQQLNPNDIYIGKKGWHPTSYKFVLNNMAGDSDNLHGWSQSSDSSFSYTRSFWEK